MSFQPDEQPSSIAGALPEGWAIAALGDIAVIKGGVTKGQKRGSRERLRCVPYLRVANVQRGRLDLAEVKQIEATEEEISQLRLVYGDILLIEGGNREHLGRGWIWEGQITECIHQNHIFRARLRSAEMEPRFFSWYANHVGQAYFFSEASQTVNLASINMTKLAALPVAVPPAAEQKRIVAKVEQLLARLNAARDRLAKVPAILKRFRQAVLAAACSGRLTADVHDGPAAGETDAAPSGWGVTTIESIASSAPRSIQSGPFGSNLLHSEFQKTGALAIGIDNVLHGTFSVGSEHRISHEKFQELAKYRARPGDVLITVMATVGRVCIVPENIENAIITKHVYRITPDPSRVLPRYLMYSLMGDPLLLRAMESQIRGQTRPGINGGIIKSLPLRLPPLSEQSIIIDRIDTAFAMARIVEERVQNARRRGDKLAQAILAKAFRGELVPTEAELAEREGREFEDAEELLRRVRAGRKPGGSATRTEKRATTRGA